MGAEAESRTKTSAAIVAGGGSEGRGIAWDHRKMEGAGRDSTGRGSHGGAWGSRGRVPFFVEGGRHHGAVRDWWIGSWVDWWIGCWSHTGSIGVVLGRNEGMLPFHGVVRHRVVRLQQIGGDGLTRLQCAGKQQDLNLKRTQILRKSGLRGSRYFK